MARTKRVVFIILGGIFVVVGTGAFVLLHLDAKFDELEGISLVLTEGSASRAGVEYTVVNNTDGELTYGARYDLQRRGLFGWEWVLQRANTAWPLSLRVAGAGTSAAETADWERGWGFLRPGTYRLVKEVELNGKGPYRLAVEFEIE